jgi:hypothetical protein
MTDIASPHTPNDQHLCRRLAPFASEPAPAPVTPAVGWTLAPVNNAIAMAAPVPLDFFGGGTLDDDDDDDDLDEWHDPQLRTHHAFAREIVELHQMQKNVERFARTPDLLTPLLNPDGDDDDDGGDDLLTPLEHAAIDQLHPLFCFVGVDESGLDKELVLPRCVRLPNRLLSKLDLPTADATEECLGCTKAERANAPTKICTGCSETLFYTRDCLNVLVALRRSAVLVNTTHEEKLLLARLPTAIFLAQQHLARSGRRVRLVLLKATLVAENALDSSN